jgi:GntR family transcriptional repressor for pyruvate dehydrogenase complex
MVRSYAALMEIAVPQAWSTRQTDEQQVSTLARHQQLARAIADGDVAAAIAGMESHFDRSIQDLLSDRAA